MAENPGDEDKWVNEDDKADREKGEFRPNERDNEVDSAECNMGDLA